MGLGARRKAQPANALTPGAPAPAARPCGAGILMLIVYRMLVSDVLRFIVVYVTLLFGFTMALFPTFRGVGTADAGGVGTPDAGAADASEGWRRGRLR